MGLLGGLYTLSSWGAFAMALLILLLILAQVVGRLLGFVVPSALELAGFATAALVFFGLAPTLREGGHVRVRLLLRALPPGPRLWAERVGGSLALLASACAAWALWRLVWDAYRFGDLAPGLLPLPLWVPLFLVALGLSVFTLALGEVFWALLWGRVPSFLEGGGE